VLIVGVTCDGVKSDHWMASLAYDYGGVVSVTVSGGRRWRIPTRTRHQVHGAVWWRNRYCRADRQARIRGRSFPDSSSLLPHSRIRALGSSWFVCAFARVLVHQPAIMSVPRQHRMVVRPHEFARWRRPSSVLTCSGFSPSYGAGNPGFGQALPWLKTADRGRIGLLFVALSRLHPRYRQTHWLVM
jgi:hypothetical protein